MGNLDGKDVIKPTPYDAHESVVRVPHTHSIEAGYQPVVVEPVVEAPVVEEAKEGE